jgi:O-antigen ligase
MRTSLMATLLAAPLAFGAVQAWAWGAMAVVAFLLLLLWSIACVRQGGLRIFWSPLYVPAGFIFLLGMIQFAGHLTMDPIAAREALLKLSTDLIFFFLAGQLFSAGPALAEGGQSAGTHSGAPRRTDILSAPALRWTLILYTFLLALFAIFQFFSSDGLIYWMVPGPGWTFGPYVNHNHYAGLMEMLIPLSVASALPALGKQSQAAIVGCLILIPIASLLLSGSRGGFLALLVEVLLTAGLVVGCGPRRAPKLTALVGGAALVAAALLFFWMAPRHVVARLARIGDGTHPRDVELGNRLVAARDTLGILRDHRWLGAGLGSFETAFPRYQSFPSDFLWDHAHNDYAEALAETGLAGGAAILGALGLFFWLAFRGVRSRKSAGHGVRDTGYGAPEFGPGVRVSRLGTSDFGPRTSDSFSRAPNPVSRIPNPGSAAYRPLPTAHLLRLGAALGCCGFLVHSFADFNFHIPANAAWFAVCAALATRNGIRDTGHGIRYAVGRWQ